MPHDAESEFPILSFLYRVYVGDDGPAFLRNPTQYLADHAVPKQAIPLILAVANNSPRQPSLEQAQALLGLMARELTATTREIW